MNQRKFFINIFIRIILILAFCFLMAELYVIINKEYYFTIVGVFLLILFQVYLLVKYVNNVNKKIMHFITALKFEDSNVLFSKQDNSQVFNELYDSFDHVNSTLQKLKTQSEKQHIYLQNIINNVGVGLISFNEKYQVDLINNAAKKMLQISRLENLQSLNQIHDNLFEKIRNLQPEIPELFKLSINKEMILLSLNLGVFKINEETIRILSLQNIFEEIEKKELESWQKLIRVLTHEIMNSVSPITSLTTTILRYFTKKKEGENMVIEEIDKEVIMNTINGLETIEDTNKNLLNFINKYRSITALSLPEPDKIIVSELVDNVKLLFEKELNEKGIKLEKRIVPLSLSLWADEAQIQQVLINIIKNSVEAVKNIDSPVIKINAFKNTNERIVVEIIDNGIGIKNELIDSIFIPFYSTKENGSGIGLSLSKQIMNQHKGYILMQSDPGIETKVSLIF
jgi:nitrogen fixation/metabolism regulation signal transduction histidine kinase